MDKIKASNWENYISFSQMLLTLVVTYASGLANIIRIGFNVHNFLPNQQILLISRDAPEPTFWRAEPEPSFYIGELSRALHF